MSCPKTQHLLTEYFSDDLPALTREEVEKHLKGCAACREELALLQATRQRLTGWQEDPVPHWDRGMTRYRADHPGSVDRGIGRWWQWLPTAASFAMLCLLLLNTTVVSSPEGVRVSFGSSADPSATGLDPAMLEQRLAEFSLAARQQQAEDFQTLLPSFNYQQQSDNQRMIQAVLEQTRQLSAENFDRFYTYYEQQRQQDLQDLQVGYQQLADNDIETIQTVYQLADFVRFQGDIQ